MRSLRTYAILGAVGCLLAGVIAEYLLPPNPQSAEPVAIVLLIDASGSMTEDGKLQEVKQAASNFVARTNTANTQLGVVVFGSRAFELSRLTSDQNQVLQAIGSIEELGATRMDLGLEQAVAVLSRSNTLRQSILLFTDGVPSAGFNRFGEPLGDDQAVVANTAQQAAAARSNGIRIVAVGTEDADGPFLAQLTGNTELVFSTTAGNFAQAFEQAQEAINSLFGSSSTALGGYLDSAARAALMAMGLSLLLLLGQNLLTLRGAWYRDVGWVLLASGVVGAVAGLVGQAVYVGLGAGLLAGWAVLGVGIGWLLGLADRSPVKALRGALGGLAGGLVGGLLFGGLQSLGLGVAARLIGFAVLGGAVGLMVQLAQEVLKKAWIVGISLGPYEGKQYILAKPQVSVGRSPQNDIALVNEADLPQRAGVLKQLSVGWVWEGQTLLLNGEPYQAQVFKTGDKLKLGGSVFQFELLRKVGQTDEGYNLQLVEPKPPQEDRSD